MTDDRAISLVVEYLAGGDEPYQRESEARRALRQSFITKIGMSWPAADARASELVRRALVRMDVGIAGERAIASECVECGAPVPEGSRLYCSKKCGTRAGYERLKVSESAARAANVAARDDPRMAASVLLDAALRRGLPADYCEDKALAEDSA
jgi:hypothetical protein